ncbi:MAG: hypothetical protein KQJ78_22580 [Deltaproteobacteria bacterium]|nr:hypothetical protein [Deltaproteobacteria bacterium]
MDWQERLTQIHRERYLLGLQVSQHPLEAMRPWLAERGFATARDLRLLRAGSPVKLAGEVIIVHTPPQKNATRVIFTTIEDETGLLDLALFPRQQPGNARVLLSHPLILVWGRLSRRGSKDALVAVNRILPPPLDLHATPRAAPRGD